MRSQILSISSTASSVQPRISPRFALAVLLLATTFVCACGQKSERGVSDTAAPTPAAVPAPTADATPAAPAAPVVTCSDVLGKMPGDKPGSTGSIPSDFPQPPAGSTLCGETPLQEVWYLNTTMSDADILEHYRKELTAQGYKVDPIGQSSGHGQNMEFSGKGILSAYVATNGEDPHAMKWKDVFKIAYHSAAK